MATLSCGESELELLPGESVLDGLLRAGLPVASSCRAGVCQSCLVQVTRGAIPQRAQLGLKAALREQGYMLACQAVPSDALTISLAGAAALELPARIHAVEPLSPDIIRVQLLPDAELPYRAGQFVTLVREDGLARAYSLASRPDEGPLLELHVRVLPRGKMSAWLASERSLGNTVRVRGPAGECFYATADLMQPLVLAGVGSGLAPLWGILRDALAASHRGPIELWHGARDPSGLYLRSDLERLAAEHPNFSYHPCALAGEPDADVHVGRLDELLLSAQLAFAQARFYLCGDAPLVHALKRALFLRGAPLGEIYADAFVGT
jgi:CDP-4-dehydro-6-deoxyglucose reductase, E3